MFTAHITVALTRALSLQPDRLLEISDALTELLAYWYKNGQIVFSPSPIALREASDAGSVLSAFCLLPAADALSDQYDNLYVRAGLVQLQKLCSAPVQRRVVGPDLEGLKACECLTLTLGIILYTHFLSVESPVRCAHCFKPIPLYRLPYTVDQEYLNILGWANDYRACDRLQMHGVVGERYHEAQLAKHDSALSNSGRSLAHKLSQAMAAPCYYFLHKARGVSVQTERARVCPSCGQSWRLSARWHRFDFRCEQCRLVSCVASSLRR